MTSTNLDLDMYESGDDDFCCGRAFRGSRISCVSTARYNPLLDSEQQIDREHCWPSSHCVEYIKSCTQEGKPTAKKQKTNDKRTSETKDFDDSPLKAAVSAE